MKTHHRRMLAREHWVRVPELALAPASAAPAACFRARLTSEPSPAGERTALDPAD